MVAAVASRGRWPRCWAQRRSHGGRVTDVVDAVRSVDDAVMLRDAGGILVEKLYEFLLENIEH